MREWIKVIQVIKNPLYLLKDIEFSNEVRHAMY